MTLIKTKNILTIVALAMFLGFSNQAKSQSLNGTPFYWKINLEYDEVYSLNGSFFAVRNGNKWGVVKENRTILPCKYDAIDALGDDMISFVENGLTGFADTTGNVRITPRYAPSNDTEIVDNYLINTFINGGCVVYDRQTKTYKLINNEGQTLLGDSVTLVSRTGNAVVIKQGEGYGMTDAMGNVTYKPGNIKIEMLIPTLFSYTVRQFNGDLLYGLLNDKGEILTEARFVDFQAYSKNNLQYLKAYLKNGLQALFDGNGKMIVDALYQVAESTVLPDFFKVTQDSYCGIIARKDSSYLMYLQPVFNDVRIIISKDTFFIAKNGSTTTIQYANGRKFGADGGASYLVNTNVMDIVATEAGYRLIVEKDFMYGVLDEQFNVVIEPKYNEVYSVVGSWLTVRQKDKWGAVNMVTKQEIEPAFEKIKIADNKSYAVFVGNKKKSVLLKATNEIIDFAKCNDVLAASSYIEYNVNKKKERLYLNGQVIPPTFLVIGYPKEGMLPVEDKKGWTYVDDKTYQPKTDKYYDFATYFFDGYAVVVIGTKVVIIDKAFNELETILECKDKLVSLLGSTAGLISLSYSVNKEYVIIRNSGKQGVLGIKKIK
ncbi:MAG: WG repeat-containing protein [Bacteroidales bacterium]|jgi:hypothetical protein|nr:WG repeat-containing protein [Bacteroidales bacterium]